MKVVVVAGPTGIGKSRLAIRLAELLGGEIINYDSVQVYRGFDIGSAKPGLEERKRVPHHLFDIVEATDEFNAADYARLARETVMNVAARGRLAILVGGTFFYLRALLSGLPDMPGRDEAVRRRIRAIAQRRRGPFWLHRWLRRVDPSTADRVPAADRHRVERALEVWITSGVPISSWSRPTADVSSDIDPLMLALTMERAAVVARIDARVAAMYGGGLVEETRRLLERYPADAKPFSAIGYREAAAVIAGELQLEAATEETKRRTRAYAKRQMTWLRSERNVQWLQAARGEEVLRDAIQLVEEFRTR